MYNIFVTYIFPFFLKEGAEKDDACDQRHVERKKRSKCPLSFQSDKSFYQVNVFW